MNNSKLSHVFPIPVMQAHLDRDFTEEEKNYVKNIKMIKNNFNLRSEETYVLESTALKGLKPFIENVLNQYFEDIYKPKNDIQLYITQSWINISSPFEQHHIHNHPNSFVSGVFYFSADPTIDKIHFSRSEYSTLKIFPREYNQYNCDSWYYPVASNDLLIFPSTLSHYVEIVPPSQNREQRISLSFNTFLKGTIGKESYLCGVKL